MTRKLMPIHALCSPNNKRRNDFVIADRHNAFNAAVPLFDNGNCREDVAIFMFDQISNRQFVNMAPRISSRWICMMRNPHV